MSEFQKKMNQAKRNLQNNSSPKNRQTYQQTHHGVYSSPIPCYYPPMPICPSPQIVIQKKSTKKKNEVIKASQSNKAITTVRKNVEAFIPINVPTREKRNINLSMPPPPANDYKEIEIYIEKEQKQDKNDNDKDNKNKQCLKKLFKKVKKLTEQLNDSQKKRHKLGYQLQYYQKIAQKCQSHDEIIAKLEAEVYRLKALIAQLEKHPRQIIKEVIIEKPVQVPVNVYHPHQPTPIRQKIVQVPKYIEVQKHSQPVYIQKPVYIDRPIQVQKIVEVPVQVPVEVPIYIDRPVVQNQWIHRCQHLQRQNQIIVRDNGDLHHQNNLLRLKISQLNSNIEVLRRHNQQKNRQVQQILHNSIDYRPISPMGHDHSLGSVKYSVSSYPHKKII